MKSSPKVVLIGAGSAFFGRQTIWSMVSKPAFAGGVLSLVDTNPEILQTMKQIAERAKEYCKVPLKIEATTDYREVLKGADFVILAFAVNGVELRNMDAQLTGEYGITLCSADTISIGGTFRTLREVPRQAMMLKDVEKICPDAWIVNWVNPTTAMGIAMKRQFPNLKWLAICDGPHNPEYDRRVMKKAGLADESGKIPEEIERRVKIKVGGVNHFNWLTELSLDGKDLLPEVRRSLKNDLSSEHHANAESGKRQLAAQISSQLAESIGYVPMCVWHTMEYLPFFQGHDFLKENAAKINRWSVEVRREWMKSCHDDMKAIASGTRTTQDFIEKTHADHASDIIEDIWCGLGKRWYLNTVNHGAISNLPQDAVVELPCVVDRHQITPIPFGEMPRPLAGWMHHVLDEHELAVDAAIQCDRGILRQALLASMLVRSIPDTEALMEKLLAAQRPFLPEAWFK